MMHNPTRSMFPKVDIAVDPLDGTSLTASGRNGAVSVGGGRAGGGGGGHGRHGTRGR